MQRTTQYDTTRNCRLRARTGGAFFFQAEDGIRGLYVTGVQTCALPIYLDRVNRVYKTAGYIPWIFNYALICCRFKKRIVVPGRSEERRVGKECRSRWSWYH